MITIRKYFVNKKSNPLWVIGFISGLNLLFMHYQILFANSLESIIDITSIFDNFCGICFDVSTIIIASYLLFLRSTKVICYFCFFTSWLWSFTNVIYSRFFHQYLTISAIEQSEGLLDNTVIKCIINSYEWTDIYYFIVLYIFIKAIGSINLKTYSFHLRKIVCLLILLFCVDVIIHACYILPSFSFEHLRYRIHTSHINTKRYSLQPTLVHFVRGSLRTLPIEMTAIFKGKIELTKQQRKEIEEYTNYTSDTIKATTNFNPENIIFILVESYMSFVSDLRINGKEVTPFLNSLQQDSSVYYNRYMQDNVTIGESSDGQFIYLTGLLPLRSTITISQARNISLPGLPKLLKKQSRMIIPTAASVWRQEEMCRQYGFDNLYTNTDYEKRHGSDLNDEQVFQLAQRLDYSNNKNFFSFIITMSMHQPYIEQIDSTFIIPVSSAIPEDLASYLSACHYTDYQIKKYFEHLKATGIYDKSLIIIAADHAVHCSDFGGVSKDLPFYIINAKGLIKDNLETQKCNQIDVYPTLLDLLGIKCKWYGMGNTLLSKKHERSISDKCWDISELIIRSNYFSLIPN